MPKHRNPQVKLTPEMVELIQNILRDGHTAELRVVGPEENDILIIDAKRKRVFPVDKK